MNVSISPNTQHYLDLYTNNLLLTPIKYSEGKVSIFSIQKVSNHVRNQHQEIKNSARKNKLEKAVELMKGEEKKALEDDEGEDSERQYSLYASEGGSDTNKKHVDESFGNNYFD